MLFTDSLVFPCVRYVVNSPPNRLDALLRTKPLNEPEKKLNFIADNFTQRDHTKRSNQHQKQKATSFFLLFLYRWCAHTRTQAAVGGGGGGGGSAADPKATV